MEARRKAMHERWNSDLNAFTCVHTGVALDHTPGSARHAEWEHRVPSDEASVSLAAAVVNRMKGNLSQEQFEALIRALNACLIEGQPFDESAFPAKWQPKVLPPDP